MSRQSCNTLIKAVNRKATTPSKLHNKGIRHSNKFTSIYIRGIKFSNEYGWAEFVFFFEYSAGLSFMPCRMPDNPAFSCRIPDILTANPAMPDIQPNSSKNVPDNLGLQVPWVGQDRNGCLYLSGQMKCPPKQKVLFLFSWFFSYCSEIKRLIYY